MRTHIITIVCIVFFISQFFLASFVFGQDADFRKRASQLREGYETSDIEAEILFGRELAAKILGQYSLLKDEELQRYVSLLGTGISAQLGRSELKYHFAVIESDDLNAYACPGGYIFITSGALKVMTNEAQLVGVLTHELTHVDQRHVVKELKIKGTDTSVTSGMAGLLGGSTTSVRVALDMLADKAFNLLFKEGLSKKDEFEADALGVTAMTTLGYDWKSYRDLVASLQNLIYAGAGETLSKTHPSISQRVEGIETAVANSGFQKLQGKRNAERFNKFVQFEEISVAQDFSDFDTRAEIALGRESAALILGKYKLLDNDTVQKYVATLGTGITAQVGRSELKYYFGVLDTDIVDSYACPGGYVFITKGALRSMTDEAQLVGLLAHEVVHVDKQHLVQQIKDLEKSESETAVKLPLNLLTDRVLNILLEDGILEQNELESDAMGIEILTTLGYEWKSYRDYVASLQRLEDEKGKEAVTKNHPVPSLRLETIEKTINQKGLQSHEGKTNSKRFKENVVF